jgi:hypothetical protein
MKSRKVFQMRRTRKTERAFRLLERKYATWRGRKTRTDIVTEAIESYLR